MQLEIGTCFCKLAVYQVKMNQKNHFLSFIYDQINSKMLRQLFHFICVFLKFYKKSDIVLQKVSTVCCFKQLKQDFKSFCL